LFQINLTDQLPAQLVLWSHQKANNIDFHVKTHKLLACEDPLRIHFCPRKRLETSSDAVSQFITDILKSDLYSFIGF
jgi:hypothetical protein